MVVSEVTESQYRQPSGFSDLDSTCLCQHMVNYPLEVFVSSNDLEGYVSEGICHLEGTRLES